MQPGRHRNLVTAALMLANALAALEATAVAASVPTAVGQLGGMSRYSWVFSAYLLTSTTSVPLYGKLADLYGRRRVFHFAVALFLLGSALSGAAGSFDQLIVFRALQGLGAGGVQPISITIVGDIFTLEERGRIQGLFSGVWGAASLLGPPLGGLVTDAFSWRWIFYLNVPLGLAAALILERYLREDEIAARGSRRLDVLGTVVLTGSITALLAALLEGGSLGGFGDPRTVALFAVAAGGLALFIWQERRAADPMLPLALFRDRLISVSSGINAVIGTLMFSITAFVPMWSQGVLGGSAVAAGAVLTPMLFGWPIASVISGRLLLRTGYRRLAIFGGLTTILGGLVLVEASRTASRPGMMTATLVIGFGLGFLAMPSLIAVQNAVPWRRRGVATSTVQFFRTIAGTVAVAALGALLNAHLAGRSGTAGRPAGPALDANAVLDPALRSRLAPAALAGLTAALASGLQAVFVAMAVAAVAGLALALLFPAGLPRQRTEMM
ncbi:MAG: MFS transporter [Acidobacteria bacterium]|nr:MFS transporter [Acidobacteriota bacterium]